MGTELEHAIGNVKALVVSATGLAGIQSSQLMQAAVGWTIVEYCSE